MGIQRSQEDSWTREMAKWEMRPVLVNGTYVEPIPFADGGRGGAPPAEYPKMLYRAELFDGGPRISDMKLVADSGLEAVALGQGWHIKQQDAIDAVGAQQLELARVAANRAYNDRLMSGKAREEAAVVDEATMQHLGEIPAKPIKRRGRPARKTAAAVEG